MKRKRKRYIKDDIPLQRLVLATDVFKSMIDAKEKLLELNEITGDEWIDIKAGIGHLGVNTTIEAMVDIISKIKHNEIFKEDRSNTRKG